MHCKCLAPILLILPAFLAGCVVVPRMDGVANVSLDDIAWRVKCDIWKTVGRKMHEFPPDKRHPRANPYYFLTGWGAKVHLTLAVDNTSSLTPGATLINPLPSSQSTTLGLGAGISTEAVSTTDYEFFMSFKELEAEYEAYGGRVEGYCPAPAGLLLESDLRIDELFDRALEPVKYGTLRVGQHPGFGGGAPPATPVGQVPDYASLERIFEDLRANKPERTRRLTEQERTLIKENAQVKGAAAPSDATIDENHIIEDNKQAAIQQENRAQAYVNNIVKPITEILAASYAACVKELSQLRNKAIIEAALVTNAKIDVDRATNETNSQNARTLLDNKVDALETTVQSVIGKLKTCPKLPPPDVAPQVYDPLDLISQSINFYVTGSGSITPGWKLVRVSAPLAPTLAAGARKDTNTLIIAFGRPDLSKNNSSGSAISNQILTSTLKDAIGPRLGP